MSTAPTVYFIDDSATMREVIKIAFRRESINVIACHDAVTALAEIENVRPDVVISDVIMPNKDGYEVCQYIKNHPVLSKTPVILMSGVVNRAVAERAFSVRADELLRKPFQPQDLITRVRHLLTNGAPPAPSQPSSAAMALSNIFSGAAPQPVQSRSPVSVPLGPQPVPRAVPAVAANGGNGASHYSGVSPAAQALPQAVPQIVPQAPPQAPPQQVLQAAAQPISQPVTQSVPVAAPPAPVVPAASAAAPAPAPPSASASASAAKPLVTGDANKLKVEIMRLEGLVSKLRSELQAEREYSRALEEHVKTLQEAE